MLLVVMIVGSVADLLLMPEKHLAIIVLIVNLNVVGNQADRYQLK